MITRLQLRSTKREEAFDITEKVEQVVKQAGLAEGICRLYVPHTTATIFINENEDPAVPKDIVRYLSELAPRGGDYQHREGNADSHIKAALIGASVHVPIQNGKLLLGTWQAIFFCELDGPRQREVIIQLSH